MDQPTPNQATAALAEMRRSRIHTLTHPGPRWVRLVAIGAAAAVGLAQELATPAVKPALDIGLAVAGIVLIGALSQRRVLRFLGLPVVLDRRAQTRAERVSILITVVVSIMVSLTGARYILEASGAPLRHTLTAVTVVSVAVLGVPALVRVVLRQLPHRVGPA